MNWLADAPADGTRVRVRIRYNHAGVGATVHAAPGGALEIRFDEPQAAVTPGQLAVLDDGERCLGGAPIARALAASAADAGASTEAAR
jgi:tRNA-specific 2-thiouridylase